MKLPKPPIGPKVTREQLQELTDLTAWDGRKYHDDLPATWDNAQFVAENLGNIDPKPGMPEGFEQNTELKDAIAKVFTETKNIQLDDQGRSPWFLAWRMYPNAEHPMWKDEEGPECGCNCGCFVPR